MYKVYLLNENYYPVELIYTTDWKINALGYKKRMANKGILIGIQTEE